MAGSLFRHILRWFVALALSWHRCRHDRRLLAALDDRALRDLGIDRAMADNDSILPFWRRH